MTGVLEQHLDALRVQGFTIVPDAMTVTEVHEARNALDGIFRREDAIAPGRGWQTQVYRVSYMLPEKHRVFRTIFQKPALLELMRAALGDTCILSSLNGYTTTPGGDGQALHLDQDQTVPGTLLTINAIHALDDFTRENGCTRLVPGSHERQWTGGAADIEAGENDAVHMEAPAGSIIAYSGGVWHASGCNRTTGPRRALHAFFAREWVRPHWNFPGSLSGDFVASLSAAERRLFGYDARPQRYDVETDRIVRDGLPHIASR
jgi:ectoine hydroxylase-related dioxygenase (phytanoyl-CoA dioxygenase family)